MTPTGSELQVPVKPDAAMRRIGDALNRPARRVLGVKIANEYVGVVQGRRFEVWERRRHAVHLLGEVSRDGDGSRIELTTGLTLRARILIVLFFALLVVFVGGMASLPAERAFPEATPFFAAAGVVAVAALFLWSARAQATDLRTFVARALEDVRSE